MPLSPGVRLGAYEILGSIGAGGMGEVYRARDERLARDVAIKVLPEHLASDPTALARFEREARAVAALSHPAILAIFDFGSADGVTYAAMELLEGETLRARLGAGPLPLRKAMEYAAQIAEGLGAAHGKGVIHRDLKPENLFITNEGRAKILDFGLARQTLDFGTEGTVSLTSGPRTGPGTVLGTVGYMSPEQVRGLPADARSDVFSFGVVLYEMLSGRRAFKGETAAETMNAILKEDPPDLLETNRNLPPVVERIVRHCLEKRAEERFHSAHDVAFALQAISAPSGARASIPPPGTSRRRRILAASILPAAAFALGVVAGNALLGTPPADPATYRRLTFERGSVGHARFAPDGNTIVYNAAWRGEPTEVFTTRLGNRESRPLGLRGATVHAVSSTSELAVGLDANGSVGSAATLARVPLVGGAPREILEHVAWADWSPDGSELAVVRRGEELERVEFPIGKLLYETRGVLSHLRISPRGDSLVFIEHTASAGVGVGSLVLVDRNGGKRTLSEGWADLYGVAWRPDGREVWFTAGKSGEFKALRAVTLDGKTRLVARLLGQIDLEDIGPDGRVLLKHPSFGIELDAMPRGTTRERDLTWLGLSSLADLSDDGSRVLFTEAPEGGGEGGFTYLRMTDGSPAVRLGEGEAGALSPDGRWATALRTSPSRLVLLPTGVGQARTLVSSDLTFLNWGAWFPDGRRVLFAATARGKPSRAYVQDLDGGEPRAIGPPAIGSPVVSPDGKTVVARGPDGWLWFPVDGGQSHPVPGLDLTDSVIRWGADGRSLFVGRRQGMSSSEVSRLELATGKRSLLSEIAARDPIGASSPWLCLTADGKSYAYSFYRNLSDLYLAEGLR